MSIKYKVSCLAGSCLVVLLGASLQVASAQNVIMGFDPMVGLHPGTFRGGANTFEFNSTANNIAEFTGEGGAFDSFLFIEETTTNGGNLNFNARTRSDTPQTWNGSAAYDPVPNVSITSNFLPVIDRAAFGHVFDPNEYEIEVKIRPVLAGHPIYDLTGGLLANQAQAFFVTLEQLDGFVLDEQTGVYKRAGEQFLYGFGGPADPNTGVRPLNDMYLDPNTAKDADGFMTLRRPLNQIGSGSKGHNFAFGDGTFRTNQVVSGGGREQDPNGVWVDVIDGLDPLSFDGPLHSFGTPQGVGAMGIQSSFDPNSDHQLMYIDVKSVLIKKINPDPTLVARLDSKSSITGRFGTSLNYGDTVLPPPINVNGTNYQPPATTEISRFDENGMTNLIINAHTAADPNNSGYQFFQRMPPAAQTFDGTDAVVKLRAKLLGNPNDADYADSLRIILKDLDAVDDDITIEGQAAEEYYFDFDLTPCALGEQECLTTTELRTITVPLASFTRDAIADNFTVEGDNDITDFNLYELTGLVLNGGGLLHLEVEYIEVRLPSECGDGDFDCDGDVDGLDFLAWQRGESPNNGSAGDLVLWETNYGTGGLQSVAAVPEPGALTLALAGLALVSRRRRGL